MAAVEDAARRSQASARRPLVIAGLVVAAVALAVGAWVWTAGQQRQEVAVSMSEPPTCTGSQVVWRRLPGVGYPVPIMQVRESMDCQVRLRVVNRGRWSVQVKEVVLPFMGPHAGPGTRVAQLAGVRPVTDDESGGTDAVFPVNRQVAVGQTAVFPVHFTFRPNGCTGGTLWFEQMPQVTVSALGWTGTVSGDQVIAFQGTAASDCA